MKDQEKFAKFLDLRIKRYEHEDYMNKILSIPTIDNSLKEAWKVLNYVTGYTSDRIKLMEEKQKKYK